MQFFSWWRSLASFRVRIALNIKGISPEVMNVDLMKGEQRTETYRKLNSQMLIPALVTDEGAVLFQSMAIMEYLDDVHPHPNLLPSEPLARARVRALSGIVASDSHPLVVPRVREYLEHELRLDEAARTKWIHHWLAAGMVALETNLAQSKETGAFCQGDNVTMADICLVSHAVGCNFFKLDLAPYPTVRRIVETCMKEDAFAKAHPLKQPGAPAAV
ncbi:maleylacetoacetate isomerase [Pseudorhodoplanes sp.]|uniref:maleylacetoacetate isomerase n=1 Tax=Pseudorhodoplanes sp. TaxID=1934341 RepID=UPI00391BEBEE